MSEKILNVASSLFTDGTPRLSACIFNWLIEPEPEYCASEPSNHWSLTKECAPRLVMLVGTFVIAEIRSCNIFFCRFCYAEAKQIPAAIRNWKERL